MLTALPLAFLPLLQAERGPAPPPDLALALVRARAEERAQLAPGERCGVWTGEAGARVRFEAGEVLLGAEGGRAFRLALARWGRAGEARSPRAPEEVVVTGRRIELRRGALVEWYHADVRGLEQGFDVDAPPARGEERALEIVLALDPDLEVEVLDGAREALLRDPVSGDVVHCSGLAAWDAEGRALDARLARADVGLALVVADRGARHPITVDPLLALQRAKLVAGDEVAGQQLGSALALDGDTALVGVPLADTVHGVDSGAAYVFVRSGGAWTQQAKLVAPDGGVFDSFGASVALDGDRALVGAPGHGPVGAAYTFVRSGSSWMREAKLVGPPPDPLSGGGFGASVALDGDTALVASGTSSIESRPPRVFTRGQQGWDAGVDLVVPTIVLWQSSTVALEGDLALAGAPHQGTGASLWAGAVYAFVRTAGVWSLEAELTPSAAMALARFGASIALDADLALIGAPDFDVFGAGNQGAAWIFRRSGGAWAEEARLTSYDPSPGLRFGQSVALSAGVALVGAPGADFGAQTNAGAAHLFRSGTLGWQEQGLLRADDASVSDAFGTAVALDGSTALVGAPLEGHGGLNDAGSVYAFETLELGPSVCDAADGALSACPCGNAGAPDSGCDNAQGTGGVRLAAVSQNAALDTAFLLGDRFPPSGAPTVVILRGDRYLAAPLPLGDGVRCAGGTLLRVTAGQASQGSFGLTVSHTEGSGTFLYQLWYRNNPASFCRPVGFNLSNGVVLAW